MADKLHVSLVTPEATLFEGEVDQVVAPGSEGEFGVLANHAPFMTTLAEGPVVILDGDIRRVFQVRGGFADVSEDGMTILAEQAEEYLETVH
ncbi:ATP synthase F1 subunit epsilon [Asticcacaulis sp. AC402]|uniref:ATP synthase F1 subunit epsilon n=1 Tax=Asticcacaulis sp. AC402 TaxID=1282361 RepID=UPI0003C3F6F1|nr:ATP synthase F1 subunit epsilon [Asticcacaulis sp. AC402]ESQ74919.1 F0F1 ATP synthase subunit epsilon [Asticcacaulis sp. AC402]